MGFRTSRRTKIRCGAALAAAVCAGGVLVACSLGNRPSEPESLVDHFAEALDNRDVGGAASLTSYPNAASATIQQMFDGLHPKTVDYKLTQYIGLDDSSGFFTMRAEWNFGPNRDWGYNLQGSVRKLAVGWRISWDPTTVLPDLGHGKTVQLVRTDAPPPRVLDAGGGTIMAEQTINAITLDPARMPDPGASTAAVAKAIEPVAPLITGQSLMQQLVVAQGKPITAVTLRDDDYAILGPQLEAIAGVVTVKQPKLITTDRRIDSPMLDPLRSLWQANRDATAGWAVQALDPSGAPPAQLAGYQGPPGPDIHATLDSKLQLAAEDAAVSVGTPSAIVAIQPSTGAVVAAAQNNQADDLGPIAFNGLFPAGSYQDLVKAAGAVEKNERPDQLSAEDTMHAASQLGLGVDYKVPGLKETSGQVPGGGKGMEPVQKTGDKHDAMMVSPFGMAVVAASIARGSVPMPMISFGQPATTDAQVGPLQANVAERLRAIGRDSMANPDVAALKAFPDVVGVPGNSGTDRWFIGSRGDLAFAVYVQNADGADLAAKMTARMFQAMARPSQ